MCYNDSTLTTQRPNMRLLCPYCQKAITVADSEAGKAVNCPECNQQFAAPQLYTPTPSVPPPPVEKPSFPVPLAVPETYTPEPKLDAPQPRLPELPAPDQELSGFHSIRSLTLEPQVIRFIPAAALFVVFVLTFFSWNGLFPGGYSAYTQNAWYGAVGSLGRDAVSDDEMKIGDDLNTRLHMSWWLLPFLILMFPALALAFGGLVVDLLKIKIPPNFQTAWKFRPAAIGLFALMMLLFVLAQWASGFALQKAVSDKIEDRNAEKKGQANTPEKMQRWEMNVDSEKGYFHARTTIWLRLAVLANLIAVLAAAVETCLMLRENKPLPRVGLMW